MLIGRHSWGHKAVEFLRTRARSARVRKDILCRVEGGVRLVRVHDDSAGYGMHRGRERESRIRLGERNNAAVALWLLLFLLGIVSACNRAADQRPSFEHAQQAFFHGELDRSQAEAEHGYQYFANSDPQLAWKFRVLEAEALMWRVMSPEVLALLNTPPAFVSHTLAVPVLTLEGLAHARLHHFSEADRKLQGAEKLCMAVPEAACGAVMRARGVLAIEQGKFPLAQRYFSQSLTFARAQHDRFLEATALLNMGTASLKQEHFDEAMDWLASARRLSADLDAGDIAQVALGDLGWAYYKLGDPERALDSFLQAEKRATQLGDVRGQLAWLTTAGYIYLDRRDYSTAEQSYQQALDLAQKISSKEDIVNALMSLALVEEQM